MYIQELLSFLKKKRDEIHKKLVINKVREKAGYSEHTWWMTTVSSEEIEVIDFEALLLQIDEFHKSFNPVIKPVKEKSDARKHEETVRVASKTL